MRRIVLVLAAAFGCRSSAPQPVANTTPGVDRSDPCELIQAMLTVDNDAYQKIYAGCGDEKRSTVVVDVRAPASLVPPNTACSGRSFSVFHGEPEVHGLIVRLDLFASGHSWNFHASRYQPNPTVTGDGHIESTQSFCHAVGGFAEWTGTSWRTFIDVDRALAGTEKL